MGDAPTTTGLMAKTAQIIQFPVRRSPEEKLQDALSAFRAAAVTSVVPVALVAALRSPAAHVVDMSIGGVPTRLTIGSGQTGHEQVAETWRRLQAMPLGPDAHVVLGCPGTVLEGAA